MAQRRARVVVDVQVKASPTNSDQAAIDVSPTTNPLAPTSSVGLEKQDIQHELPHLVSSRAGRAASRAGIANLSIEISSAAGTGLEADEAAPGEPPSRNWNMLSPSFAMEHVVGLHSGYSPKRASSDGPI